MAIINGDSGDNTLLGTDADDTLNGKAGNDALTDDLGDDVLNGGDGNDTLNGGAGSNVLNGGAGNDTIQVGGVAGAVNTVYAGAGDDGVSLRGGVQHLHGGAGFDTLFLFDGNVFHDFSAANGFEELFFDSGFQHGTVGDDLIDLSGFSIRAGSVTPFVMMEGGADRFVGSGVAETVSGGAGADTLLGGGGNDSLSGDVGADVLDGGEGDDRLDGGVGLDTASYASATARVTVSLLLAGAAQDTSGAGFDTLISIANLTGSAFSDDLRGDNSANVIAGGAGDDGMGGGGGADVLIGGLGRDTVQGGLGADRFVFLTTDDSRPSLLGGDIITDFQHGQGDLIDLSAVYAGMLAYLGAESFTAAGVGEVQVLDHALPDSQLVKVDTDGDGHANMFIVIAGGGVVDASDFVL